MSDDLFFGAVGFDLGDALLYGVALGHGGD